ncbi:hypothetical protein H072_4509 [Dactylellina haptotyla CBS 200.50]|uniref:Metallo-dependent hydrolase n=1 Tax=Dactylellina haptotyla (strain CBS 200.50) TaxID=1284197 RepID=S8AKB0_DACHA|nr:hypothetical protein H072_4509 [Dactylellina haptotyla CBS 200.50]
MSNPAVGTHAMVASENPTDTLDDAIWSLGIHDAHCHPTDTMDVVPEIPQRRMRTLTIMSTKEHDQELVAQIAREYGVGKSSVSDLTACRVVPSFGWHPWFSHLLLDDMKDGGDGVKISKSEHYSSALTNEPTEEFIATLPEPKPLSQFIAETRKYLEEFPSALVGEVGIDRQFRLPNVSAGPDEKHLSPHRVNLDHQKRVLEEQLRLAGEMGRAVSVHGVAAHGILYDSFAYLFKGHEKIVRSKRTQKRGPYDFEGDDSDAEDAGPKPFPPRICLHSFSAPPDFIKTWLNPKIPAEIYFSFSHAINVGYGYEKFPDMLKLVPEDKLLIESDLHIASIDMEHHIAAIVARVAHDRGWKLEETVKQLGKNWNKFVYGSNAVSV